LTLAIICDQRPRNALAGEFTLLQFRIDVLHAISLEIRTSFHETALQGHEGFSHAYITKITGLRPYLVSGNRAGTYKEPEDLFHFLFGLNDGWKREHWENRPFRTLYAQIHEGLGLLRSKSLQKSSDDS
jgi:hypothetical protein